MPQPDTSLHYHSTNTGLVDCAVRLFTKVNKAKGRPGWISLVIHQEKMVYLTHNVSQPSVAVRSGPTHNDDVDW